MDDLAQDLSYALEESSTQQIDVDDQNSVILTPKQCRRLSRKQRGKKRRSDSNLMWEYGNISEASESSLDEALKDYMENVGVAHNSDTDDNQMRRISTFNVSLSSAFYGESDSVTENPNSVPPKRRRRRTKRMSMETNNSPCTNVMTATATATLSRSSSLPDLLPNQRQNIRTRKRARRNLNVEEQMADIENDDRDKNEDDTKSSEDKQKHKNNKGRDRKVGDEMEVCSRDRDNQDDVLDGSLDENDMDCSDEDTPIAKGSDSDTSSLSDSSDEAGLYTNDEGREGDDEQSDFFHEPGSVYGVPSIVPWWEKEGISMEEDIEKDPHFESILNGAFPIMSKTSQTGFQARQCRLHGVEESAIRKRRRRLKEKRASGPMLAAANDRISQFMVDPQQNELWMHPMKRHHRDQLGHLASLYALDMRSENDRRKCRPVLVKNRNSRLADERVLNAYMERAMIISGGTSRRHPYAHHHSMEAKRRRKTSPLGASNAVGLVGVNAEPIPESNIGNKMLQSMGWTPGTGLGVDKGGIQEPVKAYMRPKGRGLGHDI
ncbi:G patch domain-containing protein 2-like [Glandiceps talaboti]